MGDGARAPRERCAECYQWREDCGQGQFCRACRLEAKLAEACLARDEARQAVCDVLLRICSRLEVPHGTYLAIADEFYARLPWLKESE